MKTLKTLALSACILIATTAVKAGKISDGDKTTSSFYAINTYIDAMSRGKIEGLDKVVDKTAKFSYLRDKNIVSVDKAELIKNIEDNKGIEQACAVSTSVVSNNADVEVVKVDMKYETFTRINYVTLTNNGSAWKITNVYSVFK